MTPVACAFAVQELLTDVQPLASVTVRTPTKLPITVVVVIAYLCGEDKIKEGGWLQSNQLFSLIVLLIDLFHSGHIDRELPRASLHLG